MDGPSCTDFSCVSHRRINSYATRPIHLAKFGCKVEINLSVLIEYISHNRHIWNGWQTRVLEELSECFAHATRAHQYFYRIT